MPYASERYGWKMHPKCRACKYRGYADIPHGCNFASTGQTRTGLYIKKYGYNFSRALLKPENCEFFTPGKRWIPTAELCLSETSSARHRDLWADMQKLYNEGKSDVEIAAALGVAESTVNNFRAKRRLPRNKRKPHYVTDEDRARMRELYDLGTNDSVISREIKCSIKSVQTWRASAGLAPNFKRNGSEKND